MRNALIEMLDQENRLNKNIPAFKVGDTVTVKVRIKEENKERLQAYTGIVIARKGRGASETFTVRRISFGEGVERVFPLHSPSIASIEVVSSGRTRRSKLYYLRDRKGKSARLKQEE